MTEQERRILALVARRTLGQGLGCREFCPLGPKEPGPGIRCECSGQCVIDFRAICEFIRAQGLEVPRV